MKRFTGVTHAPDEFATQLALANFETHMQRNNPE